MQLHAAAARSLGVEHLRDGRVKDAEKAFTVALDASEQLLDAIRGEPGFGELNEDQRDTRTALLQIDLDVAKVGLAYIRLRLGDTEQALPLYKQAIDSRREIFERRPNMLIMKLQLAGQLKLYGKSLLWIDRYNEAEGVLQESVDLHEQIRREDPEKVEYTRGLAESLYFFSTVRALQGQKDEATSLMERCRLLRQGLYEASPDEKNQLSLMLAEARMGNINAAMQHVNALGMIEEKNSEAHLERARALAYLSQVATDEEKLLFIDKALSALERAVSEGFSDPFRIKAEYELRPLRNNPRFEGMLAEME